MSGLPPRWSRPALWPRVGSKYVHICDAASQVYDVLYGDTDGLPQTGFVRHVAQVIGDWCRDGAVPSFVLPLRSSTLLHGEASDWIGGSDLERISGGYIQRRPAGGGKIWTDCDVYLGRDAFIAWMSGLREAQSQIGGPEPHEDTVDTLAHNTLPQPTGAKAQALLRAFYERFRAGLTEPTSTAEYHAVKKLWTVSGTAPGPDTWDRNVKPYYLAMIRSGGRWHMDPQTTAAIERVLRI